MTRIVLIPGVLALLPEYASVEDPVAGLREVVLEAVSGLGGRTEVLADRQGRRVGQWALEAAEVSMHSTGDGDPAHRPDYLVVGNGSAKRSTGAPGYFDERAAGFDAELGRALKAGAAGSVAALDMQLAKELWASVEGIVALGGMPGLGEAEVLYEDDPFGVQYWVMRWQCVL